MEEEVRIREMRSRRPGAGEDATEMLARSVAELRSTEMSVAVAVERLQEMDVQLKDARVGLVDFLAYRDGELVELCWRLGEASVASWHRIGEGFAGRKPL